MCEKRRAGTAIVAAGTWTWRPTLPRWHGMHSRAHCPISAAIFGHTNLEAMSLRVARVPGWPTPWMESKTGRLKAEGTNGRKVPVDMSPWRECLPTARVEGVNEGLALRAATSGHVVCAAAMAS